MSVSDDMTPPVHVALYEHQVEAFLFVLRIFEVLAKADGQISGSKFDKGSDANEHFHG